VFNRLLQNVKVTLAFQNKRDLKKLYLIFFINQVKGFVPDSNMVANYWDSFQDEKTFQVLCYDL